MEWVEWEGRGETKKVLLVAMKNSSQRPLRPPTPTTPSTPSTPSTPPHPHPTPPPPSPRPPSSAAVLLRRSAAAASKPEQQRLSERSNGSGGMPTRSLPCSRRNRGNTDPDAQPGDAPCECRLALSCHPFDAPWARCCRLSLCCFHGQANRCCLSQRRAVGCLGQGVLVGAARLQPAENPQVRQNLIR